MTELPRLFPPASLNYIGLFLSLECNLACTYCINDPEQAGNRHRVFPIRAKSLRKELSPQEWARGLNRLPFREDLPITLQGGEPMIYLGGKGVGELLSLTPHYYDLLTNFALKPAVFARNLLGQQRKLKRDAPYPSIRVSYHASEMDKVWHGRGFAELVDRCALLADFGFDVSPVKADSDVGIYMVAHPENSVTAEMEAIYTGRVPFETKEFLGVYDGALYGHYLYPFSTDLIARGISQQTLNCECKTSELLLDPLGFAWGCHYYLYERWTRGGPLKEFESLEAAGFRFSEHGGQFFRNGLTPIGHILDPDFSVDHLDRYRPCDRYGRCVGCDTKVKNNRFQSYYDAGVAHTSVSIRNIEMPAELIARLDKAEFERASCFLSSESYNHEPAQHPNVA